MPTLLHDASAQRFISVGPHNTQTIVPPSFVHYFFFFRTPAAVLFVLRLVSLNATLAVVARAGTKLSVVLLLAIIGAILIARRDRTPA